MRAEERAAAVVRGRFGVARERRAAGERLEAVDVAAAADDVASGDGHLDVADVARAALRAAVQLPAHDQPAPMPVPILTKTKFSTPRPIPAASSPSAITFTSLSTQTGHAVTREALADRSSRPSRA